MTLFFYDSFAVIEYLKDNLHYVPYFEEHSGVLTTFNVVEVYYSLLREAGKEVADTVLEDIYPLVVIPKKETIQRAMQFRLEHSSRKLSYADCVGYAMAQERGILFLTGDRQFQDIPGVVFIPQK